VTDAAPTGPGPARIDVHAHFLPEAYREAAIAAGHGTPDGIDSLPEWSAVAHLELMDRCRIAASLLSLSSPGVHFGSDGPARDLARAVNEEGHATVRAHPGRFGHLATLPLPDVEGSLDEMAFALDDHRSDGVALLTNVDGLYLGDPALDPVFAE
jgi:hypothetical protein